MFKKNLEKYEGILLVDKNDSRINSAIHMFFMRFDIAVVWINAQFKVVDVKHALPWRPSYIPAQPAKYILETRPEYIDHFHIDDQLNFIQ
jgi:uncharacterized membrane protein (UPF0127 family)